MRIYIQNPKHIQPLYFLSTYWLSLHKKKKKAFKILYQNSAALGDLQSPRSRQEHPTFKNKQISSVV